MPLSTWQSFRSKHVVVNRKDGNQVFYSLRDPVLVSVLDILKRYFYSQLSETMTMLKEIRPPKRTVKKLIARNH